MIIGPAAAMARSVQAGRRERVAEAPGARVRDVDVGHVRHSSSGRVTLSVVPANGFYRLMIKETATVRASYSPEVRGN